MTQSVGPSSVLWVVWEERGGGECELESQIDVVGAPEAAAARDDFCVLTSEVGEGSAEVQRRLRSPRSAHTTH